ncbi:hypothetical protein [Rhizobium sp. AN80A]|nr:hypothetical protein [Rhizobium sp. AN80A]
MKINEINTMRQGATEFIYRLVKFLSGGKIHAEKADMDAQIFGHVPT